MDCLVTKLKSSVNNSDLKRLGEVSFNLASGSSATLRGDWFTVKPTVFLKSGNVTCVINGATVTLPYEIPRLTGDSGKLVITASENSVIGFTSAYKMEVISSFSGANDFDMDVKQLEYAPIINAAVNDAKLLHGDIKYLYKPGNTQTTVTIGNSSIGNNLFGDISVFGNCLSLTTLSLRYQSGVSGSMESLVHKFRENERTTGTLTISVPTSGIITFNGVGVTGNNKTLSWDATTITYDGTTITA